MSSHNNSNLQRYLPLIQRSLENLGKTPDNWSEHTDLANDIGLTSLQAMELIALLEDELDVTIPLNILPEIRTIGDLAHKLDTIDE